MRIPLLAMPFVIGGIILALAFVGGQSYTFYESTQQVLSESSGDGTTRERPNYDPATIEFLVHQKVNEHRLGNNQTALSYHSGIADVARLHSADMVARNYFEHDSPEGIGPDERGVRAGFTQCGDPDARAFIEDFRERQDQNNAAVRELNAKTSNYNSAVKEFNQRMGNVHEVRDFRPNQEIRDRQQYVDLNSQASQLNAEAQRLDQESRALDSDYVTVQEIQHRIYRGLAENIMQGFTYESYAEGPDGRTNYLWYTQSELANVIVESWITSPEHNANLLLPWHASEGIGVVISEDERVLVTQNFC